MGDASLNAGVTAEIDQANIYLNREIVDGQILSAEGVAIDWNGANDDESTSLVVSDNTMVTFAEGAERFELAVDGALTFGPARIGGKFGLLLGTDDNDDQTWTITVKEAFVELTANGAKANLVNGAGTLFIDADKTRSGQIMGDASLTLSLIHI